MKKTNGYTLTELLMVVAIAGILAAILVPSWLGFVGRIQASKSRDAIQTALYRAKSEAKLRKSPRSVYIRQRGELIEYALVDQGVAPTVWVVAGRGVIDSQRTTFYYSTGDRAYRFMFSERGAAHGQLGRITILARAGQRGGWCVTTSTLLGAIRSEAGNRCL